MFYIGISTLAFFDLNNINVENIRFFSEKEVLCDLHSTS